MNVCDLIMKTKRKEELSRKELSWLVSGYVSGEIPDYQMSAWLMAVCFSSLTDRETEYLTAAMRDSGDILELSAVKGVTVDKHSTGGIGDKTSLVIAPICAACGIKVPKMSGRGLGFTGGTIDKLESIPGFRVNVDFDEYLDIINRVGAAIISQSGQLVPADKKMYALRDVTATVDSIPLICSSIMSKKLATGCDCILLDVKTGSGAFMKKRDDALRLAQLMVKTGKAHGKSCRALITDMDEPLGNCVGNSLEVLEAAEILKGNLSGRLTELCVALAANMLELAGKGDLTECEKTVRKAISDGSALNKFSEMITAQGGDSGFIKDSSLLPKAKYSFEVKSDSDGFVSSINSEDIGMCAMMTGAGRRKREDKIDSTAGIVLDVHRGDRIKAGDRLMTLYSSEVKELSELAERAKKAVAVSAEKQELPPIVIEVIK